MDILSKAAINREELSMRAERQAVREVQELLIFTYGPEVRNSSIWPVLFEVKSLPDSTEADPSP